MYSATRENEALAYFSIDMKHKNTVNVCLYPNIHIHRFAHKFDLIITRAFR
jgi:hypothetical protein